MHITSRDNPRVKEIVRLRGGAAARREAGLMVCEGPVLLDEALGAGHTPAEVFALEAAAEALPSGLRCPVHTVAPGVLKKLSDTQAPQGLVFTLPIPAAPAPGAGPLLALDGIADPGNLGTILRTAEALGAAVALLPGCADPTAPKVVRATMGALFRAFPYICDHDGLAGLCGALGVPILAATVGEDAQDVRAADLGGACILIGNEAHGVSPRGLDICQKKVIIPMRGAQSLNAAVAAAILLWEAVR